MQTVLTLVAGPGETASLARLAAAVAAELAAPGGPDWLAPGQACDLFFDGGDAAGLERRARGVIGDAAVDIVAQPAAARRKRLLVADLEATIIENELIDDLADFVGRRAEVAEITRQAMNGEIDFAAALETRVGLLRGLPEAALERAAERIRVTAGAAALVATMRAHGGRAVLVSGGFTVFAERVGARLGFDRVVANRLELEDGCVRGRVSRPIVTGAEKRRALLEAAADYGVPPELTLAVGDGANDLPMLAAAGLGIAFHAKPAVAAAAHWRIDHADLGALLYLQGYREAEIRAAAAAAQL